MQVGEGRSRQEDSLALSGNQRRYLRSLGHHLDPVVQVGKSGVTEAVGRALDQALLDHELVKVKLAASTRDERAQAVEKLAELTGSECAQVLGRTALLYLRRKENPKIELPKPRGVRRPPAREE